MAASRPIEVSCIAAIVVSPNHCRMGPNWAEYTKKTHCALFVARAGRLFHSEREGVQLRAPELEPDADRLAHELADIGRAFEFDDVPQRVAADRRRGSKSRKRPPAGVNQLDDDFSVGGNACVHLQTLTAEAEWHGQQRAALRRRAGGDEAIERPGRQPDLAPSLRSAWVGIAVEHRIAMRAIDPAVVEPY